LLVGFPLEPGKDYPSRMHCREMGSILMAAISPFLGEPEIFCLNYATDFDLEPGRKIFTQVPLLADSSYMQP
jgi:hypothetical protein